jgi:hypothetical protein
LPAMNSGWSHKLIINGMFVERPAIYIINSSFKKIK